MNERELASAVDSLADSLRQLALAIQSPAPRSSSGSSDRWEVVDPDSSREPGSREAPGPSSVHHSELSAAALTELYNRLEASFPAVPERCVFTCRALSGAASTPEARASRAWVAGLWARAVLEDKVPRPRPSAGLASSLPSRIYIVLRCSGLDCPARFSSARDFKRAVGRLEGSNTLCHGFASLSEALVYCEAAGVELPSER